MLFSDSKHGRLLNDHFYYEKEKIKELKILFVMFIFRW